MGFPEVPAIPAFCLRPHEQFHPELWPKKGLMAQKSEDHTKI